MKGWDWVTRSLVTPRPPPGQGLEDLRLLGAQLGLLSTGAGRAVMARPRWAGSMSSGAGSCSACSLGQFLLPLPHPRL